VFRRMEGPVVARAKSGKVSIAARDKLLREPNHCEITSSGAGFIGDSEWGNTVELGDTIPEVPVFVSSSHQFRFQVRFSHL